MPRDQQKYFMLIFVIPLSLYGLWAMYQGIKEHKAHHKPNITSLTSFFGGLNINLIAWFMWAIW